MSRVLNHCYYSHVAKYKYYSPTRTDTHVHVRTPSISSASLELLDSRFRDFLSARRSITPISLLRSRKKRAPLNPLQDVLLSSLCHVHMKHFSKRQNKYHKVHSNMCSNGVGMLQRKATSSRFCRFFF